MTNCKDCKSKYSCPSASGPEKLHAAGEKRKNEPINYLRGGKKKPMGNPKPLNYLCHHSEDWYEAFRYQCPDCLKEWVWAVGPEEAIKEAAKRKSVCSDRLRRLAKEYLQENPDYEEKEKCTKS